RSGADRVERQAPFRPRRSTPRPRAARSVNSPHLDQGDGVAPIPYTGVQVADSVDAGMDVDVSFAAPWLPASSRPPALGEVRSGNAGAQLVVALAPGVVGWREVRERRLSLRRRHAVEGEEGVVGRDEHGGDADMISAAHSVHNDCLRLTGADESSGRRTGVRNVANARSAQKERGQWSGIALLG